MSPGSGRSRQPELLHPAPASGAAAGAEGAAAGAEGAATCWRGLPVSDPARAVFISYASQDAEAARRIAEALRAGGVEVWFDREELRGGDAWDQKIRRQIRDCALLMPLISRNTNARSEGYFRREWKLGVERTHDLADDAPFLVPVLIDDTSNSEARVPDRFRDVQWTTLPGGEAGAEFVTRVAKLLEPDARLHAPAPLRPARPSGTAAAAADSIRQEILARLRRHNVGRVALLYIGICWVVLQPADIIFHMLGVSPWVRKTVLVVMVLGFPLAVLAAWTFEVTPAGLRPGAGVDPRKSLLRYTSKRLNRALLSVLALMIAYLLAYHLWLAKHLMAPVIEEGTETLAGQIDAPVEILQRSIAVLPFADLSQAKDQEYLSDGLAEELLDLLAKLPALRVAARRSAFAFRNKTEDVQTIGRKLRVAHILEGSVRKAANRVRITAQLIRADTGYQLWSETYERDLSDIFALQDEIARAVVQALKVALLGGALPARAAPRSPEAYSLYLHGRFYSDLHTKDGLEQAIDYFQRAIALDPGFEPTWTALAFAYSDTAARGFVSSGDAVAKAREAAARALKLDPRSARAHVALGLIHMNMDWDWAAAEREFKEALAADPGNATVLSAGGYLELAYGRTGHAATLFQQALARDPLHAASYNNLGITYYAVGRYADAEAAFRKSVELRPAQSYTHSGLALVLLSEGKREAALEEMAKETDDSWRLAGQAIVAHALGRRADESTALTELSSKYAKDAPYAIATVYAVRGDKDQAFQWLDQALAERDGTLATIKVDPLLKPLAADARYSKLLGKLGLPQ